MSEDGTPEVVPGSNMPEINLVLEEVDGRFAVRVRGMLMLFPPGLSRKDAERAVALGIEIYKQRLN